jgi:hypothetical protein
MTMGKMENIGGDGYGMLYIDTNNFEDIELLGLKIK